MRQRIDDEIREQELKEKAKTAALIKKILTPEGTAELDKAMEIAKRSGALEKKIENGAYALHLLAEKIENERKLAEKTAELNAARWEKFENEIKEKLSLWLADLNEPVWKQIEKLQERIAKLEPIRDKNLSSVYSEKLGRCLTWAELEDSQVALALIRDDTKEEH